jgi:hypothetical protein
MTNYLLVECIIDNLVRDRIINPPSLWKKTAIGTQFYFADFIRTDTGYFISLRISVVNGNHVITSTAFINQAKFLNVSPARILEECKL